MALNESPDKIHILFATMTWDPNIPEFRAETNIGFWAQQRTKNSYIEWIFNKKGATQNNISLRFIT